MKITISGQDYTKALDALRPLTIERKLNEPSICELLLTIPVDGELGVPTRNASVSVIGDDGTIYFTGYIAVSPLPEYLGAGIAGPRYRYVIQALSDEFLLDQILMPAGATVANESISNLLGSLVTRSGSHTLSTSGAPLTTTASNFSPEPGARWSESAGAVSDQTRTSYRALNGTLTVTSIGTTVHPLNETDGTLTLSHLSFNATARRSLTNDVTVCGEHEPVAYVTEYFEGDGTTTQFYLNTPPFFGLAAQSKIIYERFDEEHTNARVWAQVGDAGCMQIGASGLMLNGGSGVDGETTLSWIDGVEVSGTQLLEAVGVCLSAGSSGVIAGLYNGPLLQQNCCVGFLVSSTAGSESVIQSLINGVATGASFAVNPANQYTLRARTHCAEMVRSDALYRSLGDAGLITTGGNLNVSAGAYLLTIQEYVDGVGGMPVVLYDGAVSSMPGSVAVVVASSLNLIGSIRAVNMVDRGSGWVISTLPGGGTRTRQLGTTAEASECIVDHNSRLVFYAGYVPPIGETIAVSYRTVGRSTGRAINSESQKSLVQNGLPPVITWIGSIRNPRARSSADCRNAALALVQAATSVSALWSGTYKGNQLGFASDVWPGDALQLTASSLTLNAQVAIRAVTVSYASSCPDLVEYTIRFSNDWASDLAIKTTENVPADAWIPKEDPVVVLANLNSFSVTAVNGSEIQCSSGVALPPGGGIEVRRRDFSFHAGQDADLVARFTTADFTIARQRVNDEFYFRLYDGSATRHYSEFSAAVFIHLPLGP